MSFWQSMPDWPAAALQLDGDLHRGVPGRAVARLVLRRYRDQLWPAGAAGSLHRLRHVGAAAGRTGRGPPPGAGAGTQARTDSGSPSRTAPRSAPAGWWSRPASTLFANRPAIAAGLPSELASHTGDHRDFRRFRGARVLVVGGGQSALECAALLQESGAQGRSGSPAGSPDTGCMAASTTGCSAGTPGWCTRPPTSAPWDCPGWWRCPICSGGCRGGPRIRSPTGRSVPLVPPGCRPRLAEVPIRLGASVVCRDPAGRAAARHLRRRRHADRGPPALRHRIPGGHHALPVPDGRR